MQQTSRYFEEIDRLRGVAILMVIFDHLAMPPFGVLATLIPPFFRQTWTGVDLFFAISGFVVFLSLRRSPTKDFYQRRFWRIAPLAFLWAAIPMLVVWLMGGFSESTSITHVWHDFLAILTLRFNYTFAYSTHGAMLLSPYWSLCVEEHFYLLLPLFVLCVPNRRQRLWLSLLVIILSPLVLRPLIYTWTQPPHPIPYFRSCTHCRLDGLLWGVLLAEHFELVRWPAWGGRAAALLGNILCLATLAFLALMPNFLSLSLSYLNWGLSLTALLSAFLVWLASQDAGYVLNFPYLRNALSAIGRHSYELYLIHMPAYYLAVKLFSANLRVLTAAEIMALTFIYLLILGSVAFASRRWIELPFVRFGRKLVGGEEFPY